MVSYQAVFIENLKYHRNKRGISQAKLAELCDCGAGKIGSIESAQAKPTTKSGRILSTYFPKG